MNGAATNAALRASGAPCSQPTQSAANQVTPIAMHSPATNLRPTTASTTQPAARGANPAARSATAAADDVAAYVVGRNPRAVAAGTENTATRPTAATTARYGAAGRPRDACAVAPTGRQYSRPAFHESWPATTATASRTRRAPMPATRTRPYVRLILTRRESR